MHEYNRSSLSITLRIIRTLRPSSLTTLSIFRRLTILTSLDPMLQSPISNFEGTTLLNLFPELVERVPLSTRSETVGIRSNEVGRRCDDRLKMLRESNERGEKH
jgi:hypothetical protein